jgi:hypothetical protein
VKQWLSVAPVIRRTYLVGIGFASLCGSLYIVIGSESSWFERSGAIASDGRSESMVSDYISHSSTSS